MAIAISEGDRVAAADGRGDRATVCYVGEVAGTSGTWVGVNWDNPNRGKHDGTYCGTRYFTAEHPTSGSFVRLHKLDSGISLAQGIRERYGRVSGHTAGVSEAELKRLQREINAPFLEVVGFDKINAQQSDFSRLRIVALNNCRISGLSKERDLGKWLSSLVELDLSDNLIKDWNELVAIGREFSKLRVLDVSGNKLRALEDNSDLGRVFGNLVQLNINNMGLSWPEIFFVASLLPKLQILQCQDNHIDQVPSLPGDRLMSLKELDLSGNPLGQWTNVMAFSHLPNLTYLNLNNCSLGNIAVPVPSTEIPFPFLKIIQLSNNKIENWQDLTTLNYLSIEELRIRSNPVLESESGSTCRQILIASIKTLKVLNGTEITHSERWGAEIDYLKKFGAEYLKVIQTGGDDLRDFYLRHPRYGSLVDKLGPPEEHEVVTVKQSLQSSLLSLCIMSEMDSSGTQRAPIMKRLPGSMTIRKLRPLVQRLLKLQGQDLTMTYKSKGDPPVEIPLDNELRELTFYGMEDGDTIVVKW